MALEKKKEPELEIIEDNDEDGLDALVNSTVNYKKASFRRAGPATYAEKTNQQSARVIPENVVKNKFNSAPKVVNQRKDNEKNCHFFSNFGSCHFEEETGRKCKFSHKNAPVCKYDGNCNRKKCMFSHRQQMTPPGQPSYPTQAPFLPKGFQPPMNPWQAPPGHWAPPTPYQTWQMAGNQSRY